MWSSFEIAQLVISVLTVLVLAINLYYISRNFKQSQNLATQSQNLATLLYLRELTPKIAQFTDWLVGLGEEEGWCERFDQEWSYETGPTKDDIDEFQSYLHEIELLSIAILKKKTLDISFVEEHRLHFEVQWEGFLRPYIYLVRKKNEDGKYWDWSEALIKQIIK